MKAVSYYIYLSSLLILMYSSMNVSFLYGFPRSILYVISCLATLLFYLSNRGCFLLTSKKLWVLMVGVVLVTVDVLTDFSTNIFLSCFHWITRLFILYYLILLSDITRIRLFKSISKITAFLICVSFVFWIMYYLGVSMPYKYEIRESGHHVYNYYMLTIHDFLGFERFVGVSRFGAFFLEPGQMATICLIFIIAYNFNFKTWVVKVFTVALLFSLSLAGYIVFVIGYIFKIILIDKIKIRLIIVYGVLMILIVLGGLYYNEGENVINNVILSRLEYDPESGIVGNNRNTEEMNYRFEKFMQSDDLLLGMGNSIPQEKILEMEYIVKSSGIKKDIMIRGIIAFILTLVFYSSLYFTNKSRNALLLLILFFLLSFIRNLWMSEFNMYLFIMAISFVTYFSMQKVEACHD